MTVLKGEGKVPILFGTASMVVATRTHRGYLARPDLAGEWPTVLIVPAAGVTSAVKDLCRRIARQGFAAVAPQPESRLDDIISFIGNPAGFWSSAEHGFGIFGIGAGGSRAITAAMDRGAAALALAATPLEQGSLGDLGSSTIPLLGLYSRTDEVVPISGVLDARSSLPHAEVVIYDNIGHDFLDDSTDDYDFAVTVDAVERLAGFFVKHLPAAPAL